MRWLSLLVVLLVPAVAQAVPKPAYLPDRVVVSVGGASHLLYFDTGSTLERYDSNPTAAASGLPHLQRTAGTTAAFATYSTGNVYVGNTTYNQTTGSWSAPAGYTVGSHVGDFIQPPGFGPVDLFAAVIGVNKSLLLGAAAALVMVSLVWLVVAVLRARSARLVR